MSFGTDESVLFIEVSLIHRCSYREVPLYMVRVLGHSRVSLSIVFKQTGSIQYVHRSIVTLYITS